MNKYELTLVVDGKATSVKKGKIVENLKKILETLKGKVVEEKEWGVKDLTYKIGKSSTGFYLHNTIELEGKSVKNLVDKLRVDTEILRYLLVKKD